MHKKVKNYFLNKFGKDPCLILNKNNFEQLSLKQILENIINFSDYKNVDKQIKKIIDKVILNKTILESIANHATNNILNYLLVKRFTHENFKDEVKDLIDTQLENNFIIMKLDVCTLKTINKYRDLFNPTTNVFSSGEEILKLIIECENYRNIEILFFLYIALNFSKNNKVETDIKEYLTNFSESQSNVFYYYINLMKNVEINLHELNNNFLILKNQQDYKTQDTVYNRSYRLLKEKKKNYFHIVNTLDELYAKNQSGDFYGTIIVVHGKQENKESNEDYIEINMQLIKLSDILDKLDTKQKFIIIVSCDTNHLENNTYNNIQFSISANDSIDTDFIYEFLNITLRTIEKYNDMHALYTFIKLHLFLHIGTEKVLQVNEFRKKYA